MKTTQGWAWLTAGVLALGLNGFYHDGGAAWAQRYIDGVMARVVNQSEAVIALASGHADRFVANTSMAAVRDETPSCRLAAVMARVQTRIARTQNGMAHFEAMSEREETALARVEAQRAWIEARVVGARLVPVAFDAVEIPGVACPRVRVNVPRMNVPEVPMVKIPAPMVHVEVAGAGPV